MHSWNSLLVLGEEVATTVKKVLAHFGMSFRSQPFERNFFPREWSTGHSSHTRSRHVSSEVVGGGDEWFMPKEFVHIFPVSKSGHKGEGETAIPGLHWGIRSKHHKELNHLQTVFMCHHMYREMQPRVMSLLMTSMLHLVLPSFSLQLLATPLLKSNLSTARTPLLQAKRTSLISSGTSTS